MKIYKISTLIFFVLLFFTACQNNQEQPKNLKPMLFTEIYQGDLSKVDKLSIRSGSTGELRIITDKEKIDQWLNSIKDIRFVPDSNQEGRSGWRYGITLYEGENEVFQFTPHQIKDVYYIADEKVIKSMEELFNSAKKEK